MPERRRPARGAAVRSPWHGVATARLVVRPQRPGQDVVLKTALSTCMRDLRSELKTRKLTAQPVTRPGCEAVRYQSPDFDVTL